MRRCHHRPPQRAPHRRATAMSCRPTPRPQIHVAPPAMGRGNHHGPAPPTRERAPLRPPRALHPRPGVARRCSAVSTRPTRGSRRVRPDRVTRAPGPRESRGPYTSPQATTARPCGRDSPCAGTGRTAPKPSVVPRLPESRTAHRPWTAPSRRVTHTATEVPPMPPEPRQSSPPLGPDAQTPSAADRAPGARAHGHPTPPRAATPPSPAGSAACQ
jgi:hypothetical protein